MIFYDFQSSCFNYRAGGIIIYKNKILLAQAEHSNYHFLPGGRIDFHESSSQGMIREIKEELNLQAKINRLLWVIECNFELKGKIVHQIGFYYLLDIPKTVLSTLPNKMTCQEKHLQITFSWFLLKELPQINLLPPLLKQKLPLQLPSSIEHHI